MSGKINIHFFLEGPAVAVVDARPELDVIVDSIMFDALLRAIERVEARWPVESGRSLLAFGVHRIATHIYRIRNDAINLEGENYAGWVRRRGELAAGMKTIEEQEIPGGVAYELDVAQVEINRAVLALVGTPVPFPVTPDMPVPVTTGSGLRARMTLLLRQLIAHVIGGP